MGANDRRSDAQNRRLRALLEDISRSKPEGREHTPETWKCLLMAALDHDRRFADAQMIDGLEGRPPVFLGYNSSLLTVEECGELISLAQEYGDRHKVRWSGGDYVMADDPLMQQHKRCKDGGDLHRFAVGGTTCMDCPQPAATLRLANGQSVRFEGREPLRSMLMHRDPLMRGTYFDGETLRDSTTKRPVRGRQ